MRLIQFLAIMLTALALVPSGAHLAALPNKMAMAQAAYFVAQQIYAGWALFGIILFGLYNTLPIINVLFSNYHQIVFSSALPWRNELRDRVRRRDRLIAA